jgi:eukaryotic-like serine/threonine-protein kinase
VPILEVGEHEGRRYFSMKLVGGPSLDRKLADYRSNPMAACLLLISTAEAVYHAHQRGVLHRDLKPSNIVLDERGEPFVTDFGLAKRVERDSELTHSGAIVGTPAYMAPEQASGLRGSVTTTSDIYGLGAVLYALLTGRAPFVGESVAGVLQKVREQAPEAPFRLNRQVPRDLEVIAMTCLEKDPRRRYGSALALADDLRRYQNGEPILARPATRFERAWKWARRRPAAAALLVVSASATLLLLASLIVANVLIGRREAATRQALERERGSPTSSGSAWPPARSARTTSNGPTPPSKSARPTSGAGSGAI